jgi:septal ring factor EnvC (AmiA/AmiB activator)
MTIANGWQRFADFLHTANLIPLVLVVSVYHYYGALSSHDPLLVALPIAFFVDLLHFRTVQRAVQTREWGWRVTAVATTLMAFGLQWMFYNQPGAEEPLVWWQALLFASIVPLGLAIMAWHHQRQKEDEVRDWQQQAAEAQERARQMQEEAARMQARAERAEKEAALVQARAEQVQARLTAVQEEATGVQERAEQAQRDAARERARADQMQARAEQAEQEAAAVQVRADAVQTRLTAVQEEAGEMQAAIQREQTRAEEMQVEAERERERADRWQRDCTAVQTEATAVTQQLAQEQAERQRLAETLSQMQPQQKAWQLLNREVQTLALVNAQLLSAVDAAEQLGVHVTTVRRKARQLQGVGVEQGPVNGGFAVGVPGGGA